MYLLKGILISEDKLQVQIIYNLDAEENANIDRSDGVIVDYELEQPEPKRGKSFIYYVNPQTKEQWYEEVDRPLTSEELLEIQNEKLDLIMMNQLESEGIL